MMPYLIAYLIPAITIALSVPMVLGKIPRNKFYGFRTAKTLSSDEIWFPANRVSGWFMIAASVIAVSCNSVLLLVSADWPDRMLFNWLVALTLALLLAALLASMLYLKRL